MQYLFYSFSDDLGRPCWDRGRAGIMHWKSQLCALCREAAWLGRTPVFQRIAPLSGRHNFDIEIRRPFGDYLDADNIEVLYRPEGGAPPVQTLSLAAINKIELQSLNIPPNEILKLSAETSVSAEQNRRFRLIWRRMAPRPLWQYQRAPLRTAACALEPASVDCAPLEKEREILQVGLRPAARIRELAAETIRQLSDSYCAVHVRRGDLLALPAIRIWTSPKAIAQSLKRTGLAPGASLYLMSDELSRRWLRQMRRQRPFLHFADFPRLAELIRPPRPDNYSLFLAEREILEHAETKFVLRSARFQPRRYKNLIPPNLTSAKLRALYHPAEIRLGAARASFTLHFPRIAGPDNPLEARRLARDGASLLLNFARYWKLRLLAPKTLKEYRRRRKELNIPG